MEQNLGRMEAKSRFDHREHSCRYPGSGWSCQKRCFLDSYIAWDCLLNSGRPAGYDHGRPIEDCKDLTGSDCYSYGAGMFVGSRHEGSKCLVLIQDYSPKRGTRRLMPEGDILAWLAMYSARREPVMKTSWETDTGLETARSH